MTSSSLPQGGHIRNRVSAILFCFAIATSSWAQSSYDAAAAFEQGWIAGSNPNGVWSYGYSSGFTAPITLYTKTVQNGVNGPNAQYWLSPSVDINTSPAAEYNNGPAHDDGNINFLANQFVLVAGIGGQYSNLVFTAPASGTYSIAATFRGDQYRIGTVVAVVANGTVLFSSKVATEGQTVPFNTEVSLAAGSTVVFSAGPGGGSQNTGLAATITGPQPLHVSQTGVTFQAVAGSTSALQRKISIISTSTPINWTATASTVTGGNWLQVTPAQGISDATLSPPSIQITAAVSNLAPGSYYGTVSIRSSAGSQVISVVLNVTPPNQSPGPLVEPTGVVFVGSPGGATPAPKNILITNPTTVPLSFTSSAVSSTAARWFQFQPPSGTVTPGQALGISVQPNAGLAAGTFTGAITFAFSDGSMRVVNLLDVMAAGANAGSATARRSLSMATVSCTPTKLLPVFTLLGVNFSSPVAWPVDIEAFIVDDCGTPENSGSSIVSFSNGDAPISLTSLNNGQWTGTWTPRNSATANLVVTLNAQISSLDLKGSATVSGASPPNPNVPIISSGGVVGTATYVPSPAPGTLISLFGIALADATASAANLPLPLQVSTTRVLLGGENIPVSFVSENQINAQVPYKLATKAAYSVIVLRGTAISTPETIVIQDTQPGVFSTDGSGKGQGHIYTITSVGAQILAAPSAPATAGDVLTIYCAGLGEVTPALDAGAPAPLDKLEHTASLVTATIGGVAANVLFAGLTPGFTGLYQVNLIVPSGVTPGSAVPLVLTAVGQQSVASALAVK